MANARVYARITAPGPNGTYVAEGEDRRIIHLQARRAGAILNVGDRVLCENIRFCEGDAYAARCRRAECR